MEKKTKIAFFVNFLKIGGVERALVNLVKSLPKDRFDITIYTAIKEGELLSELERIVEIKEIPNFEDIVLYDFKNTVNKLWKEKKITKLLKTFLRKCIIKINKKETNFLTLELKNLEDEYDIAVSYQVIISPMTVYVSEKVKAKRKILWSHCDISAISQKEIDKYLKYMKNYQYIVSVSMENNEIVKKKVPTLKDKCIYLDNVIDEEDIISKSNEEINDFYSEENETTLLTVGRLAKGKGYDLAIKITSRLIEEGYKIKWFVVGDGEERENLQKLIKEYKVENKFILLGSKKNPYPYFRNANIYVQPSEYEGACTARIEASILNKPIITTNTGEVKDVFENLKSAIIVNYEIEEIYNGIKKLLDYTELQKKLEENLKQRNHNKTKEIYDIFKL